MLAAYLQVHVGASLLARTIWIDLLQVNLYVMPMFYRMVPLSCWSDAATCTVR